MSLFKEHFTGGLISYSIFYTVALGVSLGLKYGLQWDASKISVISLNIWIASLCFITAMLSGLWPDVDIKSTSQKIFYRLLIAVNFILIYRKFYLASALLGLFAMLPLIGKHRGWTHSRITMFLLPALFLLPPIYSVNFNEPSFDYANPDFNRLDGLPFYIASLVGYATHLYLDGILFGKWFKKRAKKYHSKK